jgi:tetratricopeptide (TPR) repeat protein
MCGILSTVMEVQMDPETGAVAQKEFDRAQRELDQNNFCIAKQRGHLTRAFELCRGAIEHDPDNPLHYLYLGKVYLVAGNTLEALQNFRQGMILGGSPELERMLDSIGTRKRPVIFFLSRDNLLNKFLGIILGRLGLR